MGNYTRGLRVATIAFALVMSGAATAWADDFVKECKISVMDPATADKTCTCMDGKITGADRTKVIATMRKTNDGLAKNTTPAAMTLDDMKAMEVSMTAQAQCM